MLVRLSDLIIFPQSLLMSDSLSDRDYGDAPDTESGTATGNYQTTSADGGASHGITSGLSLGRYVDGDNGTLQNATADADDNEPLENTNNGDEIDGLLNYEYYDLAPPINSVNDIPDSGADATGTVNIDLAADLVEQADLDDLSNFGIRYTGSIYIETPGTYTFHTTSDDGSQLSLDGNLVVDNDGLHPFRTRSGTFTFSVPGTYPLEVKYFEAYGLQNLTLEYEGPGIPRTEIPSSILSTNPDENPDDEDGINSFEILQADESSYSVTVNVTNTTGENATLVGWIDFDRDGVFSSDEAVSTTIDNNQTKAPLTWGDNSAPIPDDITAGITYARFRLSTDTNLTTSFSTGALRDGEVEDYQITIEGTDYGDAPDAASETAIGDYQTTSADNGAGHIVTSNLSLGNSVDADNGTLQNTDANADGADEDGIGSFATLQTDDSSYSIAVNVTNTTGENATLVGWIDFDRDGVFSSNEAVSTTVNNNQTQAILTWDDNSTPIAKNITAGTTYARFRLSTDTNLTTSFSTGLLNDGEVEDYQITIEGVDYGDAPDPENGTGTGNYQTTQADVGASHIVTSGLRLGRYIDGNNGTLANTTADADDNNTLANTTVETDGTPENTTADPNNRINGLLNYEYYDLTPPLNSVNDIPDSGADAKGTVNIDLAADLVEQADQDDSSNLGIRFTGFIDIETPGTYTFYTTSDDGSQLSLDGNLVVDNDGLHPSRERSGTFTFSVPGTYPLEVEYFEAYGLQNLTLEYEGPGIPRTEIPSSVLSTNPNDEDSIRSFAPLHTNDNSYSVSVNLTNTTGENATLVGWIDFDRDGVFRSEEAVLTTVNNNQTQVILTWDENSTPIADDILGGTTYARFRLSTDTNLTTSFSTGALSDGEVEDYLINIINVINGDPHSEEITGITGDDIVTGGEGQDTLTGNGGNDRFVLTKTSDGVDIIEDFDPDRDLLDFSAIIAGELSEVTFTSDPFTDGYVVATAFGSHTMIQLDFNLADSLENKDIVLLRNVDFNTIDTTDFIFA